MNALPAVGTPDYVWHDTGWKPPPLHELVGVECRSDGAARLPALLPTLVRLGLNAVVLDDPARTPLPTVCEWVDRAHAVGIAVLALERDGARPARDAASEAALEARHTLSRLDGRLHANLVPVDGHPQDAAALRGLAVAWTASASAGLADGAERSDRPPAARRAMRWCLPAADAESGRAFLSLWRACALLSPPMPVFVERASTPGALPLGHDAAGWRTLIEMRRLLLRPRLVHGYGRGSFRIDRGLLRIEWPLGDGSAWNLLSNLAPDTARTGQPSGQLVHSQGARAAPDAGTLLIEPGGMVVTSVDDSASGLDNSTPPGLPQGLHA